MKTKNAPKRKTTRKDRLTREVERGIAENLAAGYFERCGTDEHGEPLYRLTERGIGYVRG